MKDVVGAIKNSPGRRVVLTVQRGPDVLEVPVTPDVAADGGGKIGVQLASNYAIQRVKPAGPAEVLTMTGDEFGRLWGQVYGGLKQLVTNFSNMAGQLSGPVAIVAAGSKIAQTDASGLVQFAAVLNINLAIVNMLPLPGLDGAYLLLLAVEALRGGQKLPRNVELGVMNGGFLLLMAVGIGLVVRDTMNLL